MNLRDTARLYDINLILGLDPKRRVHVCPFPQHAHSARPTPSLGVKVYRDGIQRFHCFGTCGLRGDSLDAMGYLQIPGYDPENGDHVLRAQSLLSQGFEPAGEPIRLAERPTLSPLLYRDFLPAEEKVVRYAKTRGLTPTTLEKFRVGQHRGAITIPTFENQALMGIKYRATWDDANVRFWAEPGSRLAIFNHDRIAYTQQPVLIVKGEIPVMLLDQYEILACAPNSGETAWDMSQWRHLFAFASKIVVVGDNDADPEIRARMQERARQRAESLGAELHFPPEKWKDVDQWLLEDPSGIAVVRTWLGLPA